jgi:hypothetical protein
VERVIGTLKSIIRNYVLANKYSWVETLGSATFAFNSSPNEVTGVSRYASHIAYQTQQIRDYVQAVLQSRAEQISNRNQDLPRYRTYKTGDLVYVEDYRTRGSPRGPFAPYFLGPYSIVKKLGDLTYIIKPLNGSEVEKETVHVKKLKPYLKRQLPAEVPEHVPSTSTEPSSLPQPPLVDQERPMYHLTSELPLYPPQLQEEEPEEKYSSSPSLPPQPSLIQARRDLPSSRNQSSLSEQEPIRSRLRPRPEWRINYDENARDFQLPDDASRLHGLFRAQEIKK